MTPGRRICFFVDGDVAITADIFQVSGLATGPMNGNGVDLFIASQAKQDALIRSSAITGSAQQLFCALQPFTADRYFCPHAIAIALAADQLDSQPVIRVPT